MTPSKRVCRYGSTDQPMLMSVATGRVRLPTAAALYQSSICGVNSAYQKTPTSDPGVCRHPDLRRLGHGQAEVPLQGAQSPIMTALNWRHAHDQTASRSNYPATRP